MAKFSLKLTKRYLRRNHGDRLFEVNSTNSFKNLSP